MYQCWWIKFWWISIEGSITSVDGLGLKDQCRCINLSGSVLRDQVWWIDGNGLGSVCIIADGLGLNLYRISPWCISVSGSLLKDQALRINMDGLGSVIMYRCWWTRFDGSVLMYQSSSVEGSLFMDQVWDYCCWISAVKSWWISVGVSILVDQYWHRSVFIPDL